MIHTQNRKILNTFLIKSYEINLMIILHLSGYKLLLIV
jgi:hypothetical protein